MVPLKLLTPHVRRSPLIRKASERIAAAAAASPT